VQRSLNGSSGWAQVGTTAGAATLQDSGLAVGTTYYYRVMATNAAGSSGASSVVNILTVPGAPMNLVAAPASQTQINLSWTDVASETGFIVERSLDGATWTQVGTVGTATTTFSDTGLTASTTYFYRVSATNTAGTSAASNVANTTTAPLAIYSLLTAIYGVTSDGSVYALNTSTGASTQIGTLAFGTAAAGRDPVSGDLYYVEQGTSFPRVATWDPTTGINTILSTLSLSGRVTRAAFRSDGTLFITAGNGNLYQVNRTTGVATSLGTIKVAGVNLISNDGDMAFSPNGTLYLATNSLLYTVNLTTLAATPVGTVGLGAVQIAFGQNGALYASSVTGGFYTLNLASAVPTLLGSVNMVDFTDLASSPLYADLSILQGVVGLVPGSNATYTVNISNGGPNSTVGPVTVTDTLPTGLSFVSASGTGWTFSVSGSTVTMTYAVAAAASTTLPTVTLTVAVNPSLVGVITSTLSVSGTIFDSNTTNNTNVLISAVL